MTQFKIYFTLFSLGSLVVVWKVSGDPVCYTRQYIDEHNSKFSRIDCDTDAENIYMRFESANDFTIGALLDDTKLPTGQIPSKRPQEGDATNNPTSKSFKQTKRATQTALTKEITTDGKLPIDQTPTKRSQEATDAANNPTSKRITQTKHATQTTRTMEKTTEKDKQTEDTTMKTQTSLQPVASTTVSTVTDDSTTLKSSSSESSVIPDNDIASTAEPTLVTEAGASINCSGWISWNTSCYLLVRTRMNWTDAVAACYSYNDKAHLVFIESDEEYEFIEILMEPEPRSDGFWLGLRFTEQDGWKWYNTSAEIQRNISITLEQIDYWFEEKEGVWLCIAWHIFDYLFDYYDHWFEQVFQDGIVDYFRANSCSEEYFFICEQEK